ncbi:zinc ABC transporter substrate-binding protein [Arenibacterium sp. CAU 1754]
MHRFFAIAAAIVAALPLRAEAPHVAADIAPVHSLVAQVMGDLGVPDLIVTPGASPHGYALRPSQARGLEQADLVVWMGPGLTPWLSKPVESLAGDAAHVELLDYVGDMALPYRDLTAADHDHDHDHEGAIDPHAWLDPQIAAAWVKVIADHLGRLDPDNGETYQQNAQKAQVKLMALVDEIDAMLVPARDGTYIAFHDAYQYFEHRFALTTVGTVTLSDAASPGPAQLSRLRDRVAQGGITCAFSEPQFEDRLLRAGTEGYSVPIARLDPLGAQLEPGGALYGDVLRAMAQAIAACAAQ